MRQTPVYDLLVVGGGTAGSMAALAAASKGLKVAVADKATCLGGTASLSGLSEMNAAGFQGRPLYKGIEKKLFDSLIQQGSAAYHFSVPMSSDPRIKVDRLRYDPEMLKLILEDMAVKNGITLLYGAALVRAQEQEPHCEVDLRMGGEMLSLQAQFLVDGTGNASLTEALGGTARHLPGEKQMTATLMFRLSNVDIPSLDAYIHSGALSPLISRGFEAGILKGKILAFTPIPGTNDVTLNATRVQAAPDDPQNLSASYTEARRQILPLLHFVKENIPALSNASLSNVSSLLGIRDAASINGEYTLTTADLENMTEFEDAVACGCYPMDFHDPITKSVIWKPLPGIYFLPLRSALPKSLSHTLVAGKCLDADRGAFSAVRTMPTMMNLGESVGYVSALCVQTGKSPRELTSSELRRWLASCYTN